MSEGKTNQRF